MTDYKPAYEREKAVRKEAEKQLENRSRDLYKANVKLNTQYQNMASDYQKNTLLLKIFRYSSAFQKLTESLPDIITSMLIMARLPLGVFDYYPLDRSKNRVRSKAYINDDETKPQAIAELVNDNFINDALEAMSDEVISTHKTLYFSDLKKPLSDEQLHSFKRFNISGILALPVVASNRTTAIIYLFLGCNEKDINDLIAIFKASIQQLGILIEHRYSSRQLERNYSQLKSMVDELDATQKKLIQAEKMASIGQLSAGIAHEINNPMGYVKCNIASLKDYNDVFYEGLLYANKIVELPPSERSKRDDIYDNFKKFWKKDDVYYLLQDSQNLLKETTVGIERVLDIVSGLKTFARASDQKWSLCDINICLEEALKLSNTPLNDNSVINKSLLDVPAVNGDEGELVQVFLNLLINARHAIGIDGQIQLSTREIDHGVEIQVSDNGCGIEKDSLLKIFDPFYTTKDVGKGTGLGLSISFGIIESHGGRIDVESQYGEGSCFTVWLPAAQE